MRNKLVVVLGLLVLTAGTASAGAWARDAGSIYGAVKLNRYQSSAYWDLGGTYHSAPCTYEKNELDLYAEYGLLPRLTLFGQTFYQQVNCGGGSASGIPEVQAGALFNYYREGNLSLAVSGKRYQPIQEDGSGAASVGTGEGALEVGHSIGRSFAPLYLDIYLGYKQYDATLPDEWKITALLGSPVPFGGSVTLKLERTETVPGESAYFMLTSAEAAYQYDLTDTRFLTIGCQKAITGKNAGDGYGCFAGIGAQF